MAAILSRGKWVKQYRSFITQVGTDTISIAFAWALSPVGFISSRIFIIRWRSVCIVYAIFCEERAWDVVSSLQNVNAESITAYSDMHPQTITTTMPTQL